MGARGVEARAFHLYSTVVGVTSHGAQQPQRMYLL